MELDSLQGYINTLDNCTKVGASILIVGGDPIVDTTTETYEFDWESSLLEKLDSVKSNPGFLSCKKKFIPAKEVKGELIHDDIWQLTITIRHEI